MNCLKNRYHILLLAVFLLLAGACSDEFLDINNDPNNPSDATLELLLPAAQTSMAFNFSRDVNENTAIFSRQYYVLSESQYEHDPSEYDNDFQGIFGNALKEFQEIIDQGTEEENWGYVGVAKINKAYVYGLSVDLWGDLPYEESLQGDAYLTPSYESSAAIYDKILALLDEGIADLAKEAPEVENDLVYGGDLEAWTRAANTVKLRLLLNLRLVDPQRATTGINALIEEDSLISSNAEDFQFQFGSSINPMNQHPIYQDEYATSRDVYMSNYFMYKLITRNDPRLRFYIYRQDDGSGITFETKPCNTRKDCPYGYLGEHPNLQGAEGYIGRDHGDNSGIPGDTDLRSIFGVYPFAGKFDDDSFSAIYNADFNSENKGAGLMPFLLNSMRAFMLAEAKLTLPGIVAGNTVREYLQEGIEASMIKVVDFSQSIDESALALTDSTSTGANGTTLLDDIDAYIQARLTDFDNASSANAALNVVMTEKYFASLGNGMEVYTDVRRTGMPLDLPQAITQLQGFPLRLYIGQQELSTNPNAEQLPVTTPLFWDAN